MRHRLSLTLFAVALLVAACSGGEPSVSVSGDCPDGLGDALGAWREAGFNGVVVVDSGGDEPCSVAAGALAPGSDEALTPESVFALGSVSKAFTAAAVLQLEADGQLDRSQIVSSLIPELTGEIGAITIDSLLSHTSGLVGSIGDDLEPLGRDQAINAVNTLTIDPSARGDFLYSNVGYTMLAMVIEAVTGVEYRAHMTEALLPEGSGFWDGDPAAVGDRVVGEVEGEPAEALGGLNGPHWATQGNGDLAMSPVALARWTNDAFAGGLLPAAAVQHMLEPAVESDGQGITDGWVRLTGDVLGEVAVAAAGGGGDTGQNVVVVWLPDSQRTIVVASSSDGIDAESLLQAIGSALVSGESAPRPGSPVDVDADVLADAAGTYALDSGGRFEVTVGTGDELLVQPQGADAVAALRPAAAATDDVVAEHEQMVIDLLSGGTQSGRDELATLAESFGDLTEVELLGSAVEDRELRTYVRMRFADSTAAGWYALNGSGGIEAVDLGGLPRTVLVAVPGGFRVDVASGSDQAVTVTFDGGEMSIEGGAGGSLTATRDES